MEHALLRTWQKAKERCEGQRQIELTIEDYESAGGFNDALSLHADEAYEEIGRDSQRGEHYQRISQLLFRSLTGHTNEGMWVRNPIKVTEAALIADASVEEVLHVMEAFRREGRNFITSSPRDQPLGRDSTLDISHESLIRRWRILRDWISAEQKDAEIYKQISYHARRWEEGNKKRSMLLRPLLLADNIAWRENLKPTEAWARRYNSDFSLCMEYLHARVLLRTAFIIFAVLILIASAVSIIALDQKQQALRSLVGAEMAKRAAERAENNARKSREAAVEGLRQQLAFFTRATEICGRIAAAAQPDGTTAAKRKEAVQKGFTAMTANEDPIAFTVTIRVQIQNLGEVIKVWEPNSQPSTDKLMQAILAVVQEYERAWKNQTEQLSKDAREFMEAIVARPIYEWTLEITRRLSGSQETAEDRDTFVRLYWGELVVMETREVESAMALFRRALQDNNPITRQAGAQQLEAALSAELSRLPKIDPSKLNLSGKGGSL
jgi:hypothetical protein